MVGPNRNTNNERGDDRAAGAECDVAEDVEDGDLVRQIDQPIEHRINLARTRSARPFARALDICARIPAP